MKYKIRVKHIALIVLFIGALILSYKLYNNIIDPKLNHSSSDEAVRWFGIVGLNIPWLVFFIIYLEDKWDDLIIGED